ncbi:uncharacterized protein SPSK_09877 [Sporothrix schenckii 1099-18]|uniref:Uncharacterized protein n=1 Tax=Sporothrix schenckii 1099-18 TaxID=1397361 RepID=A0A0F2M9F3_SPOSC|nr:uncharacterized protein SPSK_09877 [Sporothrix schenckii 1099-18]KJR85430.1 hypothetical protein SPSK_09877 [Sporothrix schenckii 1099-18]
MCRGIARARSLARTTTRNTTSYGFEAHIVPSADRAQAHAVIIVLSFALVTRQVVSAASQLQLSWHSGEEWEISYSIHHSFDLGSLAFVIMSTPCFGTSSGDRLLISYIRHASNDQRCTCPGRGGEAGYRQDLKAQTNSKAVPAFHSS